MTVATTIAGWYAAKPTVTVEALAVAKFENSLAQHLRSFLHISLARVCLH